MNVPALVLVALAAAPQAAPKPTPTVTPAQWMPLIRAGKYAKARALCEGWIRSSGDTARAEGHKCLANVELGEGGEKIRVEGDGRGGGVVGSAYDPDAAARAVAHLDLAAALAPQDLSIHQGRLHVLELASQYERMQAALEQSISVYRGPDALDAWLAYPAELISTQPSVAEALLLLLEKHYPGDHRIAGNLAALYGLNARDEEALSWAKQAVAAAPTDPIDNWNLARIYDDSGKLDLADAAYQKAVSLQPPETLRQCACIYAEFLQKRVKDVSRACKLEREHGCGAAACGP